LENAEGKEGDATLDASNVKMENLEVGGGKCLRGKWQSVLNVTETWILPPAVLLASVAYALLAIVFYNKDV